MRKGNRTKAINYARKNFPIWVGKCFPEIKRVMGLLAFPTPDEQSPIPIEEKEAFEMLPRRYQLLYGEQSWKRLNEAFNREQEKQKDLGINSFDQKKKINKSSDNKGNNNLDRNTNCPICHPLVNKIAENYSRNLITHSLIICPLSGQIMTPDNPPMIFTNGNAYSLDEMEKNETTK
ncbi:e3 ubiquitin-protein transferase maea [Anaeramoeba flamelloides]|uniref:E3 ubiquitin-protein transferase maea n=1 Tax=Anaeramoeba flamelloides TaxID=1746091 RepID=A0AAV8AED9_9EUKA|nr:e3 ubiquitin-protein transferase maea [Anaeramoeba flamelloides]